MKKEKIFIFICLVLLSACSPSSLDGIVIEKAADGYKLYIDGKETYIKGVGGTYRLDIAAQSGANAFRTWGGNVEEINGFGAQHVRNAGNRHDQRLHTLLR